MGNRPIKQKLVNRNSDLMRKITKTFAECRSLDFNSINDDDILILTSEQASEYSGDKGEPYFKIWMVGTKIAWCTWGNSMIDSKFRWNEKESDPQKKRDNTDILGNEPFVSDYLKHWSARKKCTTVYMFPFAAFSAIGSTTEKVKEKSTNAKQKSSPVEKTSEQKAEKMIDKLTTLAQRITWRIESKRKYKEELVEFNTTLERLKCLDENNKMIPYFEKIGKEWTQQPKGILKSIVDMFNAD